LVRDYPSRPVPEEKFFWIFVEPGKIMEAEAQTVQVDATPTELTAPPSP